LGPLGTAATNRPIVPAPVDCDYGEIGGMTGRGNRSTWRKPVPVPLCPPQNPHAARTRTKTMIVNIGLPQAKQDFPGKTGLSWAKRDFPGKTGLSWAKRDFPGETGLPQAKRDCPGQNETFLGKRCYSGHDGTYGDPKLVRNHQTMK
jgi:hypothetical protein